MTKFAGMVRFGHVTKQLQANDFCLLNSGVTDEHGDNLQRLGSATDDIPSVGVSKSIGGDNDREKPQKKPRFTQS